jgi:putative FmdB family regulatory protein
MPIYEYICKSCSSEFELIQKFSDPPVKKCPSCGGKAARKISLSSFQLKGSGWYLTDYARKDQEKKAKKEKPESSSSPSKEEGTFSSTSTTNTKTASK